MIIKISEYAAPDNASVGFKQAVAASKTGDTILFDAQEYHFFKDYSEHRVYHMTNTDSFVKPDKYFAMLIENKDDLTIDGNGATFVIHGDMCAFALVKCSNIKLKNFTIRYNAPTNIELTVKEKSHNKITYTIPKRTDFYIKRNSIYFFEQSPFTQKHYYELKNNKYCYCNVIHRGDEVFRTQLSPFKTAISIKKIGSREIVCKYIAAPKFQIGDTVCMSKNWCRDNCGLFFWECSDISSENLVINYMHGFGWLAQMCNNLDYKNISFVPAEGYKVTSFADLIHICGCKGSVNIDKCLFTHAHDDGINIHGAFLRLKKIVDDKTAVFEFVHKQQGGYRAFFEGDKVHFYSSLDLSRIGGEFTVLKADDDINKKLVTLSFKEQLPPMSPKMAVCENITYNPKVKITNCTFKAIPTRGILCTTDRESEICNNTFTNLKMSDIFISCDCKDWFESGPCKNLKIHDNKFSQKEPVLIKPISVLKPVDNVHDNIQIYDNTNGE